MPPKKGRGKKPARSQDATVAIPKNLTLGVPEIRWAKLVYSDKRNLDPGTDSTISWIISANGMYDPDITGTGGQPRFYDQYAAMYTRYCVEAADIEATFIAGSTTSTYTAMVGIDVRSDATAQTAYGSYLEGRHTRLGAHVAGAGGPALTRIKHHVNIAKWHRLRQALDRQSLTAATSANPTDQLYFHLFATDADPAGGDPGANWTTMRVTFYVRFFDPISVVAS
jgi:hypothetical protein